MIDLQKTDASKKDFLDLIHKLDGELKITDGEDHDFYAQFNQVDHIKYVIVAYEDNRPVGCGAIKEFDAYTMEIKRMYVNSEDRGKGIASEILETLEQWASDLGYQRCILETGVRQLAAIALYKKNNFKKIHNYGQYTGVTESVCFEKQL